jgi:glycosyltransferase involved in cell wall biosynthesis
VLAEFEPECVVSYWTHPDGAVAVRAARMAGVPAAVMVGGSDALLLTQQGSRRQRVVSVLESADAVVTVGRDLRDRILGLGIQPEKVHIVARGIDTHRFVPGDRTQARRRLGIPTAGKVLLWVGNMVPLKALDVLLEACGQLVEKGEAFRIYLIGNGPQRQALETECRARGLSGVVSFVGSLHQDQLPDWYRAADLTVLPSRSEGVPNVLRESLACGTPFVASRVGGIPELAQDPISRLVPPGDGSALAEGIVEALADASAAGPLRSQATGSWTESAECLVRILRPLISGPWAHTRREEKTVSPLCPS